MATIASSNPTFRPSFKRLEWRVISTLILSFIIGCGVLAYVGTQIGGVQGCFLFLTFGPQFIEGVRDRQFLNHLILSIITGERNQ